MTFIPAVNRENAGMGILHWKGSSMRIWSFCILTSLFSCLGCNFAEESRLSIVENTPKQIRESATSSHQSHKTPYSESAGVLSTEDESNLILLQFESNFATDASKKHKSLDTDTPEIVKSGNQFALDLYQQLRVEKGNLFFSPSSISISLAMTYAGSVGETEAEMAKTLHFEMPNDQVHNEMQALQALWEISDKTSGIQLKLANRLWGMEGYEFLPEFLGVTRDKYGAELLRLNFRQSEKAEQTINTWVKKQTENKIIGLIPKGTLSSDTRLVLTNAVYFHGHWTDPFKKSLTKKEEFQLATTDRIKVPMMHQWGKFRFSEIDDIKIIELPYGDGSLSMFVLLPKEVDGLARLESKLTPSNLQHWISSMKDQTNVEVSLPKFKMTSQFKMSSTLQAMGMKLAFNPTAADFSGMTGEKELYISNVIHQAFVDVNEEGTEAAAATASEVMIVSAPRNPPVFRADHPFIFLIGDNRNSAILFLGRIENPLK